MTDQSTPALPASDPYARAADLDDATVARLAERLDIRAADPRQHQLWHDFLARAPRVTAARVLEVGCGTGIITAKIAELPGVAEAVGVDPNPGFVDRARRRAPTLRFDVADGRTLPHPDAAFDGVVFATTLCHIREPEPALAEARRVLRPGGYLLVYDGDYASATVALGERDPLQACVSAAVAVLVHDPWLIRRLPALLDDAGFDCEPLVSHGYVEADVPAYLPSMVDVGADTLAAQGIISAATASALKAEARHRARSGRFFGHIAYASMLARRPASTAAPDSPGRTTSVMNSLNRSGSSKRGR
jgi:SAM-dependent methyltransferase